MRAIEEAGTGTPPRLIWRTAEVLAITEETPRVRTLALGVPGWPGHLAGQHLDVRLTAPDGYSAQRSYSIGSPPETPHIELTVQRLEEGEVSPYLAHDVRPGDRFEVRGPIGGHFVWAATQGGPLLLIAGGSGVVPLMAMLRHRAAAGSTAPAVLLYSSRTFADIIFRAELERLATPGSGLAVVHTLTDSPPADWTGFRRRIDRAMIETVGFPPDAKPRCFICGPTGLVESAARTLVEIGHAAALVKTERFGPTGG
ncbi:MAG: ferredoxin reductase [Bauldia sp.]|nr:ferredoxin reductase [Bauldia sp.]